MSTKPQQEEEDTTLADEPREPNTKTSADAAEPREPNTSSLREPNTKSD